jgi:hypothetical protein
MFEAGVLNRIEKSRQGYENTGSNLEQEFLGTINSVKYKGLAYKNLHQEQVSETADPREKFEKMLKIKETAQKEFDSTLALADRNKYINFKDSMALVEKCQVGNPENPSHFFSKALYDYIRNRLDEKYILKFFTAVGGTHLDIVHKIDFYFKLYNKESGEELTCATIDITGRKSKDKTRANVLLNIDQEERDQYDPSQINKNFDREFFNKKIAVFGEEIIKSLIENYQNRK